MQLSIVVTSYDPQRRRDIMDLLDSIQAQVCNDFKVVYITERSKLLYDFVKEAIEKRGIRGMVIHNEGSGGAMSQYCGSQMLKGDRKSN
jgi:hypothetical protein